MGMFDDVLDNVGEPYKGGKGFEWGTHDVIIGTVTATQKKTKADPDAAVIEVEVFDPADNDRTAKTTLYFHTEGGARMSVTKVLGLLVHKVSDDKKDQVRDLGKKLFGNIDDPKKARDIAAKLMTEKLVGEKAFMVVEPQGNYKTSSYGDIWHYAAEPQTDAPSADPLAGATPLNKEEAADAPDFPDDL